MRFLAIAIALVVATPALSVPCSAERAALAAGNKRLSGAQIKKILIDESIASYDGNCPCPYSRARNGSRCGKRSAYSRPGGESPLCYPEDVTSAMLQAYRDAHPDG